MPEVDLDLRPGVDAERTRADLPTEDIQLVRREHASPSSLASRNPLQLTEFLEGIDAHVRVGADADGNAARPHPLGGKEAVAEVSLRGRARADRRAVGRDEVELGPAGVGRMDDRRPLALAAPLREELDRPAAVLGKALLDFFRLLV